MGLSATTSANTGLEGVHAAMIGGDVFVGHRIAPRITLEGSFAYAFENGRWAEGREGAPCTGNQTHQWHWQSLAARAWIDTFHTRRVRFSIAPPSIAVGILADEGEPGRHPCGAAQIDRHTWLLSIGVAALSLDVSLTKNVELRAWTEASLLFDGEPSWFQGALSFSVSLGPTFRF